MFDNITYDLVSETFYEFEQVLLKVRVTKNRGDKRFKINFSHFHGKENVYIPNNLNFDNIEEVNSFIENYIGGFVDPGVIVVNELY